MMQTNLQARGHQYLTITLLLAMTLAIAGQLTNTGPIWGAAVKSPLSSANATLTASSGGHYYLAQYRYYYPRVYRRYYYPRVYRRYYYPRVYRRYYYPRYRYYRRGYHYNYHYNYHYRR